MVSDGPTTGSVVKNSRVMDQLIFAKLAPFEDEEELALDR